MVLCGTYEEFVHAHWVQLSWLIWCLVTLENGNDRRRQEKLLLSGDPGDGSKVLQDFRGHREGECMCFPRRSCVLLGKWTLLLRTGDPGHISHWHSYCYIELVEHWAVTLLWHFHFLFWNQCTHHTVFFCLTLELVSVVLDLVWLFNLPFCHCYIVCLLFAQSALFLFCLCQFFSVFLHPLCGICTVFVLYLFFVSCLALFSSPLYCTQPSQVWRTSGTLNSQLAYCLDKAVLADKVKVLPSKTANSVFKAS